jgi:uncharacterized protein YdaU (DUF1376 family)
MKGAMSKRPDTWMPLYIGDYLRKTMHLTIAQHGAYLMLIMACWCEGGTLPDDDEHLAAICRVPVARWRKLRPAMMRFFEIDETGWHNSRVSKELAKAEDITTQRRNAGHASAAAKAQQTANKTATDVATPVVTNGQQNPRPSQSHTQSSSLRSEDYSEPLRASGSARAPPMPPDGAKSLWDKGLSILGPKQRSLLGKLRKSHGDPAVLAAIVQCEEENPSDPPAFLIACCQRRHDNDRKLSPVESLYLGAARAADAFDRRQREAACCPDCDAVEPLLDRRRSAC